jgi:hypothetical protein
MFEAFVGRAMIDYLQREPDFGGINFFSDLLYSGQLSVEQMQATIFSSVEYGQLNNRGNQAYVHGLFRDILGREPTGAEFAAILPALNAGGSRYTAALNLLLTPEAQSRQLRLMYNDVIGNFPSNAQHAGMIADLNSGMTQQQIAQYLVQSGGDSSTFAYVERLYETVLQRIPSSSEITYWVNMVAQGRLSREQVGMSFLTSTEYRLQQIDQYYLDILGRTSDSGGRQFWLNVVSTTGRLIDVQASLFSSEEFLAAHGGNASGYISALYDNLLDRTASVGEIDYWVAVMGFGPRFNASSRAAVALGFIGSAEYRSILIDLWFDTYLDRTASFAEMQTFQSQLAAGATHEQIQIQILLLG